MTNQRITPSHLDAHLKCPTRVHQDAIADRALMDDTNPFVQLLWERGTKYEKEVVQGLALEVLDLSALKGGDKEAATRAAIRDRVPLIYAGRLSVDDFLGEPDLLRLEQGGYAPIDIKSGAGEEGGDDEEEGKPRKTYGAQISATASGPLPCSRECGPRTLFASGRLAAAWDEYVAGASWYGLPFACG